MKESTETALKRHITSRFTSIPPDSEKISKLTLIFTGELGKIIIDQVDLNSDFNHILDDLEDKKIIPLNYQQNILSKTTSEKLTLKEKLKKRNIKNYQEKPEKNINEELSEIKEYRKFKENNYYSYISNPNIKKLIYLQPDIPLKYYFSKNYLTEDSEIHIEKLNLPQDDFINHLKKNFIEYELYPKYDQNKNTKFIITGIVLFLLTAAIISFILIYFLIINQKNYLPPTEKFAANINYENFQFMRFLSKKETIINFKNETYGGEKNGSMPLDSSQKIIEFQDSVIGIYDHKYKIIKKTDNLKNNITTEYLKNYYSAFIGIINISFFNETTKELTLSEFNYDLYKIYNYYLTDQQKEYISNFTNSKSYNETIRPILKFEFSQSGEIINIESPIGISDLYKYYLNELIQKLIPKISLDLYSNSADSEEFEKNYKNSKLNLKTKVKKRILNEDILSFLQNNKSIKIDSNNLSEQNNTNSLTKIEFESSYEIINTNSIDENIEIRQYETYNNLENSESLYTNLTNKKSDNIESDYMKLDGSEQNRTIINIVNDKTGKLEKIIFTKIGSLMNNNNKTQEDINYYEEINSVYNENNSIKYDINDSLFNNSNENIQNIAFDNIIFIENETIERFGEDIIDSLKTFQIIKYLNKYNYYKDSENKIEQNSTLRILSYFDNFIKNYNITDYSIERIDYPNYYENQKKIRKLESSPAYFGIMPYTYTKSIVNINLFLFSIKCYVINSIEPSTGVSTSTFVLQIAIFKLKFKFSETQTNLHVIIKNLNLMTYDLMQLTYSTSQDFLQYNVHYANSIINYYNNISNFFVNGYSFGNIYKEPLENLYNNVKNFASELFNELIILINNTESNYTIYLAKIKNNEFDVVNEIRTITKNEYINYVYKMLENLDKFENETLDFFDNLENELKNITYFQIDVLFDIIDLVYDIKLIFKDYIRNLYKAIERGIKIFRYDLSDNFEELMGELLYLTDFLSINLNRNEIIKNSIDEKTRNMVSLKCRNFRNIINDICDFIIDKINNDYENEINGNNSIKLFSENKVNFLKNEIEKKSNNVIDKIKLKIKYIEIYELYSSNLDYINEVDYKIQNNFMNNFSISILEKIKNIKSGFLEENNKINLNKNKLFNSAKTIVQYINNEAIEIINYVKSYTNTFMDTNLQNYIYNLYYFRISFLEKSLTDLRDIFLNVINNVMKNKLYENINTNFDLGNAYLKEEDDWYYHDDERAGPTDGFKNQIKQKYIDFYNNYLELLSGNTITDYIEEFYNLLKEKIKKYVFDKINSINEYYFNNDIYKKNFLYLHKFNNEIINLSNNITLYFNDEHLNLLKTQVNAEMALIISNYSNKLDKFINFYTSILEKSSTSSDSLDTDFKWGYKPLIGPWNWRYETMKTRDNYKNFYKDLENIKDYIRNETDIIYNNFINQFKNYIDNYVNYSQSLYNSLNEYLSRKINNNENLNNLLYLYQTKAINICNKHSNFELLKELYNENNIDVSINEYIDELNTNMEEITNFFYNNYYLKNFTSFLDFPYEIYYKIKEIYNIFSLQVNIYKNFINSLFRNKITKIIGITNTYIYQFNEYFYNYIINTINYDLIITEYKNSKINIINNSFNETRNILNNLFTDIKSTSKQNEYLGISNTEDFIYNSKNYNSKINILLTKYNNFMTEFNTRIYNDFTVNITHKKHNYTDYSKYNFDIVKIRYGLYYTKFLLENLTYIFDEIKFEEILNTDLIIKYNTIFNDYNEFNIYVDTKNKIKEINSATQIGLNEIYNNFKNEIFKNKFSLDDNLNVYLENLTNLLQNKNNIFDSYIEFYLGNMKTTLLNLLNNFNYTLFNYILQYDYFNIDFETFNIEEYYLSYYQLIYDTFSDFINSMSNTINMNTVKNSFLYGLRKIEENKRNYLKNSINEYVKENFDFNFLNVTFDLGTYFEDEMFNLYYDKELLIIYNYYEIISNNVINFENLIKKNIYQVNLLEFDILDEFDNIFDDFINFLNENNSYFFSQDYANEYYNNYTICLSYPYNKINEFKIIDEENYNNYLNTVNLINILNERVKNGSAYSITNNENIFIIYDNNIYNITYLESIKFENKTEKLLFCNDNDYFNKKIIFLKEVPSNLVNELNTDINIIQNYIIDNKINSSIFVQYAVDKINLPNYLINMTDYYSDLDDAFWVSTPLYIKEDDTYINLLNNLLNEAFINSNKNFLNNYLQQILSQDFSIVIKNNIESQIFYLTNKINQEYDYIVYLIGKADEIGISTKKAITNLYKNFNSTIKNIFSDLLFELVDDNLNFFYRENKKLIKNLFINYFENKNNDIKIYKIDYYLNYIINDYNFSQNIDNLSNFYLQNYITNYIKNSLYNEINPLLNNFYSFIDQKFNNINNSLSKIKIADYPDDMEVIINLIDDFKNVINQQSNKFNFTISNKPLMYINNFITQFLAPPLYKIKELYDKIEQDLLNQLLAIIKKMEDPYNLIVGYFNLEHKIEYIKNATFEIYTIIDNYFGDIINETDHYYYILNHYTLISGLVTLENPQILGWKDDDDDDDEKSKKNRNLEEKKVDFSPYKIQEFDKKLIKNFNKLNSEFRNLNDNNEKYDENSGSLTKINVIASIIPLNKTFFDLFDKYFNCKELSKIIAYFEKYKTKIFNDLETMSRNIESLSIKFGTILTKDNYQILKNNLYKSHDKIYTYFKNDYISNLEPKVIEFTEKIEPTKLKLVLLFNLTYNKILNYYDQFYDKINNEFEILNKGSFSAYVKWDKKFNKENNGEDYKNDFNFYPKDLKYYFNYNCVDKQKKCFNWVEAFKIKNQKIEVKKTLEKFAKETNNEKIKDFYTNLLPIGKKIDEYCTKINNWIKDASETIKNFSKKAINSISQIFTGEKNNDKLVDKVANFIEGASEFLTEHGELTFDPEQKIIGYNLNFKILERDIIDEMGIKPLIFPLPIFPLLQFRIPLNWKTGVEINIGLTYNYKTKPYYFMIYFDICAYYELSVSAEVGFYLDLSIVKLTVTSGVKGVIVSAIVGFKLDLNFRNFNFSLDLYGRFKAFEISVYFKFHFLIKLIFFKFVFEFYIFNFLLCGLKFEKHSIKSLAPAGISEKIETMMQKFNY